MKVRLRQIKLRTLLVAVGVVATVLGLRHGLYELMIHPPWWRYGHLWYGVVACLSTLIVFARPSGPLAWLARGVAVTLLVSWLTFERPTPTHNLFTTGWPANLLEILLSVYSYDRPGTRYTLEDFLHVHHTGDLIELTQIGFLVAALVISTRSSLESRDRSRILVATVGVGSSFLAWLAGMRSLVQVPSGIGMESLHIERMGLVPLRFHGSWSELFEGVLLAGLLAMSSVSYAVQAKKHKTGVRQMPSAR